MASRSWLSVGLALVLVSPIAMSAACSGSVSSKSGGKVAAPVLPPADPEAVRSFQAGLRALKLGGPEAAERAIPRFRDAVARDGQLWEAWHALGVTYFTGGDDDAAIEAFSKAIAVNPAHAPSLFGRAEAYRRSDQPKEAREDYQRALKQSPEDSSAYARAASLLRETGDLEDALDILRESLRLTRATPEVYVELGLVYLAQGRDELAELVLSKAIALYDKNPSIHNAMALVALARGRDQEAFNRFDHASSLDPTFLDARFNVASVLIDAGDYQRAQEQLQVVVTKRPTDFGASVALGVAHRGLGNFDRARAIWEDVVKGAPRRSAVRSNALYNLAVLEMDFAMDEAKAKAALDRYLQQAGGKHPKRAEAEERRKELGQ